VDCGVAVLGEQKQKAGSRLPAFIVSQ